MADSNRVGVAAAVVLTVEEEEIGTKEAREILPRWETQLRHNGQPITPNAMLHSPRQLLRHVSSSKNYGIICSLSKSSVGLIVFPISSWSESTRLHAAVGGIFKGTRKSSTGRFTGATGKGSQGGCCPRDNSRSSRSRT